MTRLSWWHAVLPFLAITSFGADAAAQGQVTGGSDLVYFDAEPIVFLPQDDLSFTVRVPLRNIGDEPIDLGASALYIGLTILSNEPGSHYFPSDHRAILLDPDSREVRTRVEINQRVHAEFRASSADFIRCRPMPVQIDLTQEWQTAPGALANDEVLAATPCLSWNTPIDASTLGSKGLWESIPPNIRANLNGRSLRDIVSSRVVARADGNRCSNCHNAGSRYPYRPEVSAGAQTAIYPYVSFNGRQWDDVAAGGGVGWALQFMNRPTSGGTTPPAPGQKPLYLKKIVERWIRDGMLPTLDHGPKVTL
jgi:hypothetical protein